MYKRLKTEVKDLIFAAKVILYNLSIVLLTNASSVRFDH